MDRGFRCSEGSRIERSHAKRETVGKENGRERWSGCALTASFAGERKRCITGRQAGARWPSEVSESE